MTSRTASSSSPWPDQRSVAALATIAQVLGLGEIGGRSLLDTVTGYLGPKHVCSSSTISSSFSPLLGGRGPPRGLSMPHGPGHQPGSAAPPGRAPVRRAGCWLATDPTRAPSVEALPEYAAAALFIQRAIEARAEFAVTEENAPAVAEICRRLDGLPLAIELAAARIKLLTPEVLLQRLERRLTLLTGARGTYRLDNARSDTASLGATPCCPITSGACSARLAVFVGGFTLDAAHAVCSREAELLVDPLDSVASLVDMNLVRREDVDGEPRFGMLETIREYAGEQLAASGEADDVRRGHAEHYLALAEESEPRIRSSPEQREWLAKLATEHDNLRARWRGVSPSPGDSGIGVRLAGALSWFWEDHGHLGEGRRGWNGRLRRAPWRRRPPG